MAHASSRTVVAALVRMGSSSPQDPDAPSFLTILLPEIRNAIYECAFTDDGPIVIVDSYEYTKPPAWEKRDTELEYEHNEEDYKVQPFEGQQFVAHGIDVPTAFLRTCRQVYHEAAGVLYGKNDFLISVASHKHNPTFRQLRTTVRWMNSIGSQFKLLVKVLIDLSGSCANDCYFWGRYWVNFGYLIKLLWARPELKSRISFTSSARPQEAALLAYAHGRGIFEDIGSREPWFLNSILGSLIDTDELNLRRYARPERLIADICIEYNFKMGFVRFSSTRQGPKSSSGHAIRMGDVMVPFLIPQDGSPLIWTTWPDLPTELFGFQAPIFTKIVRHVVACPDTVVFDLDRRTVHGSDLGTFAINRQWRDAALGCFYGINDVTLLMSTEQACTSFSDFSNLRQFLGDPLGKNFSSAHNLSSANALLHLGITSRAQATIMLSFEIDMTTVSLQSLEINMTDFIQVTHLLHSQTTVQFRLGTRRHDSCTVSLHSLRQDCFLLLSWVITRYPSKVFQKCPKILFNGEGRPLRVMYSSDGSDSPIEVPATPFYQQFREGISESEKKASGMQYVAKLEHYFDSRFDVYRPSWDGVPSDGSMMAIWRYLQRRAAFWVSK